MARTPPTLVDSNEVSSWSTTGTSKSTGSVAWQTGDLILVVGGVGDESSMLAVPTATGLTFSEIAFTSNGSGNFCDAWIWTATAGSNGSGTIDGSKTSGPSGWGMAVLVVRGSEGTATEGVNTSTTKTVSVARSQAESAVVYCGFDWSASSAAATFTPGSSTTIHNAKEGSSYSVHIGYWADQNAAGTTSYGVTSTSTGSYAKIAVEVLGAESSTTQVASGTVAATSASTGTALARFVAAGVTAAVTTVTGTPIAVHPITGTSTAQSAATGTAAARLTSAGTTAATSTTAGALTARLAATGVAASTSATTGDAGLIENTEQFPASGTVAATTTVSGTATALLPTTGTAAATSTTEGAPTKLTPATGTVAATSAATGDAGIETADDFSSSGTVTAASTTTGAVTALRPAAGAAASTTTITGAATALLPSFGTVLVTSDITGAVTGLYSAAGTVEAASTATGAATNPGAYIDYQIVSAVEHTRSGTANAGTWTFTATAQQRTVTISEEPQR